MLKTQREALLSDKFRNLQGCNLRAFNFFVSYNRLRGLCSLNIDLGTWGKSNSLKKCDSTYLEVQYDRMD